MPMLSPGDSLPPLKGFTLHDGLVELPNALPEGRYGVVLAYRAHW